MEAANPLDTRGRVRKLVELLQEEQMRKPKAAKFNVKLTSYMGEPIANSSTAEAKSKRDAATVAAKRWNNQPDKPDRVDPTMAEMETARDSLPRNEEAAGVIRFAVFGNKTGKETLNGSIRDDDIKFLVGIKNLFSRALPKMPKEYIARIVMDRKHRTLAIVKTNQVIGGICFRPFDDSGFVEIVFCAIASQEQVKVQRSSPFCVPSPFSTVSN